MSFAMPVAVLLSQCTDVGGCGCPISCKIKRKILVSLPLINKAPNSASAADAATADDVTTDIFAADVITADAAAADIIVHHCCC